jgi:hypothetical protein
MLFFVLFAALGLQKGAMAQVSITSGGTNFTQNFDGIGVTATAALPSGWRVAGGAAPTYAGGTSACTVTYGTTGAGVITGTSAGGAVNYGNGVNASATDRSVGFLTTGGFTSPRSLMVQLTNNTGSPVTALSVSFDYEKYRSGTRAFDWTFFYSLDGTSWTAATTGDQSYAADANNTTIFNPPTAIAKSVSITGLSLANTSSIYIRWAYTGLAGSTNAQGLAVDNVVFNATTGLTPLVTSTPTTLTDFGSVNVGSQSTSQITEVEGVDLSANITVTAPTHFLVSLDDVTFTSSVTLTQSAGVVAATNVYVRFAPTAAGAQSGSISVTSGSASDPVSVSGTGVAVASALSDIIADAAFTAPSNIAYNLYQESDLTSSSLEVARFIIRDGGAAADADALSTILNSISFTATGNAILNRVAIYDGTTEVAEIAAGATASFTGLTLTASDDATKTFSIRVSFLPTVTDNVQFSFTVASASANIAASTFAAANAGAAASSIAGDDNRIEVTATALNFTTQPINAVVNAAMGVSVVVRAQDALGNTDADATAVSLTSSGTLTGSPVVVTPTNGVATFVGLTHTAGGTGLTLTATMSAVTGVSSTFNIAGLPIAAWDFFGQSSPVTVAAEVFDTNLNSAAGASNVTRGPGAASSAGSNSFRTVGFQNNGIATTNSDYFQVTLAPINGYKLSLSTIDARLVGTTGYAVTPGVTSQFAYSLDGTNFTLIGSPQVVIGTPQTLSQIDVSGISALQNLAQGTTVYLRYYASGQTATGGWGFNSAADNQYGLTIGGSLVVNTDPTIIASTASLTGFVQTDVNPSTEQSYTVSADNLTASVLATASAGYEVSLTSGSGFGSSVTLTQTGGNLDGEPVTVYVRQNGASSGTITHTSAGATNVVINLSGSLVSIYYSKATGDLNDLSTWGLNTDGTGTAPADFATASNTFIVTNRATATISANWTVSGAGSKVVVGNGTLATDFTIPSSFTYSGIVEVANLGELTIENSVLPTFGPFAANSTIEYSNIALTIPSAFTYGNLILSGTGTKTFGGGNTTVAGNITLNNVTIDGPSVSPFSTIRFGGNLTYTGTVTPPATANSITLQSTGTAGGTQTIFANGNQVRWFRIQTTTANTLVVNGSSEVLLGNNSGGGFTAVDLSLIDLNTNNVTLFNTAGTGNAFVLNTTGALSATGGTWNLARTGNGNFGTIRFSSSANTVSNLILNHIGTTNNQLLLGSDLNVTGIFTLTEGRLVLGANNFTLMSTASQVLGTLVNDGVVTNSTGEMRVGYASPVTFPLAEQTTDVEYSPITVTYTSSAAAPGAYVAARVTDAIQPSNASTTDYITRYWSIGQVGFTGYSNTVSASYLDTDIVGTEANMITAYSSNGSLPFQAVGTVNAAANTANSTVAVGTGDFTTVGGPAPTVSANADDNTVCSGTTVNFTSTASGASALTYAWTSVPAGFTSSIANPSFVVTANTTFTVTVTDLNGLTASSSTVVTLNTEICGNGIDDDCDTLIDEGCSANTPANDNRGTAVVMLGATYPLCSNTAGTLLNAGDNGEALSSEPVGTGEDVWYRFVAQSQGARIQVNSTQYNLALELQDAAGTTLLFSENETASGQEVLIASGLTVGATYYVAVRNFGVVDNGTFTICIQHLRASVPNNGTTFSNLCAFIKASWTGAQLYSATFVNGLDSYTASNTSTQIPFSLFNGLEYGTTYSVTFSNTFILPDAGGNNVTSVVTGAPFNVTIAAHPAVQLRAADRCPTTRARGSFISTDVVVCGATEYEWEFIEVDANDNVIGIETILVESNSTSRYLRVSQIPGVQDGDRYRVRIRPVFSYGPGTFTSGYQLLCVAGQAPINAPILEEGDVFAPSAVTAAERAFEVYPNPNAGDVFNVRLAGINSEVVIVRMLDAMGRVVYNNQFTVAGSLNTSIVMEEKLSSGMYMIQVIDGEETMNNRMIVR